MNESSALISQFIDDELSLAEKREFLVEVSGSPDFAEEAISLVDQELMLASDPFFLPENLPEAPRRSFFARSRPALALAAVILLAAAGIISYPRLMPQKAPGLVAHRFVIYEPGARNVEISGNFNEWAPIGMRPAGNTGYWEAVVNLPPGEYRFSYLVGADRRIPDPTLLARETDGFGGENSILTLEAGA